MADLVLTAAELDATNPVLAAGQRGIEVDTFRSKDGDGDTPWRSLPYTAGPAAGRVSPGNVVIAGDSYLDPLGVAALPPNTIGDRLTKALAVTPGQVSNIAVSGSMVRNHFTGCSYAAVWNRLARRRSAAPYTPNVGVLIGKWGTNDAIRGDSANNLRGIEAGWLAVIRAAQSGSMYPHDDPTVSTTGTWLELLWEDLGSEPYDVTAHTPSRPWGYGTGCWRTRSNGARIDIDVPADHTGTVDLFLIGSWFGASYQVLVDSEEVATGSTEHFGISSYGPNLYDERNGTAVTVTGLERGVSHEVSLVATGFTASSTSNNPSELRFAGWSMRCLEGTDPLIIACQTPIVPTPGGFWVGVTPKIVRNLNRQLTSIAATVNGGAGRTWPVAVADTEAITTTDTFPDGAGHPNNAGAAIFAGKVTTAYTRSAAPGSASLWAADWEDDDDVGGRSVSRLWVYSGAPTGFADDFNRANSTSTLGSPWSALRGTWGINSNAAYLAAGTGNPFATDIAAAETSLPDAKLTTVTTGTAGDNQGVAFRVVDNNNYLSLVQSTSFGVWVLRATVAGAVVTSLTIQGPYTAGTVVEILYVGTSITVLFNGTASSSGTQTLSQHTTATKVGFVAPDGSTIARWDSIAVVPPMDDLDDLDWYLDRDTSVLYGPYSSTSGWPSTVARTNRFPRYTTAGRPTAATLGAGAGYFDTTLNKPVWSDGTVYRDATGTTV